MKYANCPGCNANKALLAYGVIAWGAHYLFRLTLRQIAETRRVTHRNKVLSLELERAKEAADDWAVPDDQAAPVEGVTG